MLSFGIIWLFSSLLQPALCIYVLVRALRIPRALRGGPTCGICGYGFETVPDDRCPECGTSVVQAGVTSSIMAARMRGGTIGAILAWTILCFSAAAIFFPFAAFALPVVRTTTWNSNETGSVTIQSTAGYTIGIDFDVTVPGLNLPADSGSVLVIVTLADGTITQSTVDAVTRDFPLGPDTLLDLDEQGVLALFDAAGLDTDDATIVGQADSLAVVIDDFLDDPNGATWSTALDPGLSTVSVSASSSNATFTSGTNRTIIGVLLTIAGIALVLYVAGIVFIVRRRKRLCTPRSAA